jgi:RHS repeat-associated protein
MPSITAPALSLPRGGGALRGLGGVVNSGASSGAATFSVPVPVTGARELTPDLSVTYSSGGGNGQLGLGMSVGLPMIARRTSKGVPGYGESDVFVLSGAGPLTPTLHRGPDGWQPDVRTEVADGVSYRVRVFRPRGEGDLPRIEQWQRAGDLAAHWVVTTADNVTSRYGVSDDGRVADPADPARVAEWLIEETADAKGNRVVYDYRREDGAGLADRIFERGREHAAQRYPARIRYGNYLADGDERFALEVVFDYGERDLDGLAEPGADPYHSTRPWPERSDPFSSYLYGFEVRTSRLCHAALMFHRFPAELGEAPCLTGALRFSYDESPVLTRITRIVRSGHRRQADGSYLTSALPPLDLTWSQWAPPPAPRFGELRVPGAAPVPGYLERGSYQPVDLHGEGLPGLLYSDAVTTLYYEPHGGGQYAPPAVPRSFPVLRDLRDPRLSLEDLDGDGRLDLVVTTPTGAGYFPRGEDGGWRAFTPFTRSPTSLAGARGELADLDGSGRSDLMLVHPRTVVVYPSEGDRGFGEPLVSPRAPGFPSAGPEPGPQFVTFAGIFGDGLAHRVRVTDGEVTVWPSLGRGRFGPPVSLADAPAFTPSTAPQRIFFADIDGSGTADLVFAYADHLDIHVNQAGNSFGPALRVPLPAELSKLGGVSFADILGTGSTSVVFTAGDPGLRHWFCDLCGGGKPYLLAGLNDNAGISAQVSYASSTRFYLEDKRAGRPWSLRLPFPVQVVEKVTVLDEVSGTRVARRHRYRDGWFDPAERQFGGFGFVESWDAETFEELAAAAARPGARIAAPRADLHAPPLHTRSWYQVGSLRQGAELRAARHREQFSGDPDAYVMPDSVMDAAAGAAGQETLRQAHAALTGQVLRTELYADDGTAAATVPYALTDSNSMVWMIGAAAAGAHGSFHVQARETVSTDYERDPADPRVTHAFGLELTLFDEDAADTYRERNCTIQYPRRRGPAGPERVAEQDRLLASVQETSYTRVLEPFRLVGTAFERRMLDIGQITAPPGGYLTLAAVRSLVNQALAAPIPYGAPFTGTAPQSRPSTWERSYFWDEAQGGALRLGKIGSRALAHHGEQAAFSATWLDAVYAGRVTDDDLLAAGYLADTPGAMWWSPGPVEIYHGPDEPAAFFVPLQTSSLAALTGQQGPFTRAAVGYDAPYVLRAVQVSAFADPDTPVTSYAEIDYQSLLPWQLTDANGIVHQALLDPLGAVLAGSVFKPAQGDAPRVGDGDLRDYVVRADPSFDDVLARPASYLQNAGTFYFADLRAWMADAPRPLTTVEVARPRYLSQGDVRPDELTVQVTYWDGAGREAAALIACDPAEAGPQGQARWIVSGRVTYDNKGRPVEEYLPYYAASPSLGPWQPGGPMPPPDEPPQVTRYDPVGRPVRVETPKGFFAKTVYGAWAERRYDEDDTVTESRYNAEFRAALPTDPDPDELAELDALDQAAGAYNTPAIAVLDSAGRAVRTIQDNLGNVTPGRLAGIVAGTAVTPEELWTQLVDQRYLETRAEPPAGTWLGDRFNPYQPGFVLRLDPPYDQFARAVTEFLLQGRLTDLRELDEQGRAVRIADPRVYLDEVRYGTPGFTLRCGYAMGQQEPALTVSADAGTRWILTDVLSGAVSSWDSRGLRTDRTFDGLRRPGTVTVTGDGTRLRERLSYGEHQPDAARENLIGQLYQVEDQAGVVTMPAYGIDGSPAVTVRQFTDDYQHEPDWSADVPLTGSYPTRIGYNAFGQPAAQTTPDGATVRWDYYRSGRLAEVTVTAQGDGPAMPVAGDMTYDPAGQRTTVTYGNGAVQVSSYEDTTQRLIALRTTSPAGETLQEVRYTFDPVGNVTLARDATASHAFCTPQPLSQGKYCHDPLYQLLTATGLQLPGLDETTYATGFKQTVFAPLCPSGDTPAVTLEPFTETYSYDNSGNLVTLRHSAASGTYTRSMPVLRDSNRLDGVPYDQAGNTLRIQLAGPVDLTWTDENALASAIPAAGPRTYHAYDAAGQRARKVVAGPAAVSDRRYLGDCLIDIMTAGEVATTTTTLRISDGQAVAAVLTGGETPRLRFELDDRLGTVAVELDGDARITGYEAFLPYGGSAAIAAADEAAIAAKTFRFGGKECDDSTALYYYGVRYATSWLGRWVSPDPGGTADGLNLYAFVRGNPVTLRDDRGYNGDDPPAAPSRAGQLYPDFQQDALHWMINGPRRFGRGVFHLALVPLLPLMPLEGELRRRWRTERRPAIREGLTFMGVTPYVPSPVWSWLASGDIPPIMRPVGSPDSPFQTAWRSQMTREQFAVQYAGGWLGQWLTVSTGLSWFSQAVFRAPTWGRYMRNWAGFAALSFFVMRAGRAGQGIADYREVQRRLEGELGPAGATEVTSLVRQATGLEMHAAHVLLENERRAQFADISPGKFAALVLGLVALRYGGPRLAASMMRSWGGAGTRSTALMVRPEPSRAMVVYRPPNKALTSQTPDKQ